MDIGSAPLWIQWVVIFLCAIPICIVWSLWDYIKDCAKYSGEQTSAKIMGQIITSEPIKSVWERAINKLIGFIVFIAIISIFKEGTILQFFKIIGVATTIIGVLTYIKKIRAIKSSSSPQQ